MALARTAVNPVKWSVAMGFNQGELVSGHSRTLYCAGQTATDEDGRPRHPDDMGAQVALCADNLAAVLDEAGMSLADLVSLKIYTVDVDRFFEHEGVLQARLGAAGAVPTMTLLGVSRLALPELMVELEGTAVS